MKTIVNLEIDNEILDKARNDAKLQGRSRKRQLEKAVDLFKVFVVLHFLTVIAVYFFIVMCFRVNHFFTSLTKF